MFQKDNIVQLFQSAMAYLPKNLHARILAFTYFKTLITGIGGKYVTILVKRQSANS